LIDGHSRATSVSLAAAASHSTARFRVTASFSAAARKQSDDGDDDDDDRGNDRKKGGEGETLFRSAAATTAAGKSRGRPRRGARGRADYGNPEKRERERVRERHDGSIPVSLKSSPPVHLRHSSPALFARGVAYDGGCHRASERASEQTSKQADRPVSRPFARSLASPSPPFASGAVFFTGHCSPAHFSRTPFPMRPRTMT